MSTAPTQRYVYKATALRVVDGDTVIVRMDLGFYVRLDLHLRLSRINTPELVGAQHDAALRAKARLEALVTGVPLVIETQKDKIGQDKQEKFGRWLAEIWLPDGRSANQILLDEGLAVAYSG